MANFLATPWTAALQAPVSMGFPRQEYWSGVPFASPGKFSTQESNPHLLHWQKDSLPLSHEELLVSCYNHVQIIRRKVLDRIGENFSKKDEKQ